MSGPQQPSGTGGALVIGLGNRFRRDDAVGLIVAAAVRAAGAEARVLEAEGEPTAVIDAWADAGSVYVIDAVASGAPAGTIHRFDALADPTPAAFTHRGTHALSIADVVELARAVDRLPGRLVIYGIEGRRFDAGIGLTKPVHAASWVATERVLTELAAQRSAVRGA